MSEQQIDNGFSKLPQHLLSKVNQVLDLTSLSSTKSSEMSANRTLRIMAESWALPVIRTQHSSLLLHPTSGRSGTPAT